MSTAVNAAVRQSQRHARAGLTLGMMVVAVAVAQSVLHASAGVSTVTPASREVVRCDASSCEQSISAATTTIVAALKRQGMACRSAPALTDHVVIEWRDGQADIVTLARAVDVASHRDGWLRSYCTPKSSRASS